MRWVQELYWASAGTMFNVLIHGSMWSHGVHVQYSGAAVTCCGQCNASLNEGARHSACSVNLLPSRSHEYKCVAFFWASQILNFLCESSASCCSYDACSDFDMCSAHWSLRRCRVVVHLTNTQASTHKYPNIQKLKKLWSQWVCDVKTALGICSLLDSPELDLGLWFTFTSPIATTLPENLKPRWWRSRCCVSLRSWWRPKQS